MMPIKRYATSVLPIQNKHRSYRPISLALPKRKLEAAALMSSMKLVSPSSGQRLVLHPAIGKTPTRTDSVFLALHRIHGYTWRRKDTCRLMQFMRALNEISE